MGFFDFFKTKKEGDSIIIKNDEEIDDYERQHNEYNKLMKEAALLKKEDIGQSIELIKQAIAIFPDAALSGQIHLANYIHFSGCITEAYNGLFDLLSSLDRTDYVLYNSNVTDVYDRLCILSYKDKDYKNYLKFYFKWLNNATVRNACQGRSYEMWTDDLLSFMAPTKVAGCFKKLNKNDSKITINELLNEYFESKKDVLKKVCLFVKDVERKPSNMNESGWEKTNKYFNKSSNYQKLYNDLNNDDFDNFIEDKLMILLN